MVTTTRYACDASARDRNSTRSTSTPTAGATTPSVSAIAYQVGRPHSSRSWKKA